MVNALTSQLKLACKQKLTSNSVFNVYLAIADYPTIPLSAQGYAGSGVEVIDMSHLISIAKDLG